MAKQTRRKKSKNYFTAETEEYIVLYNNSEDQDYRNKIFTDHIYFPFYKLAENIIHTFKFYSFNPLLTDLEKLATDILSLMDDDRVGN